MDGAKIREEVTRILGDLIRIDTTNPPGNESDAAVYLKNRFQAEGIEAAIYESSPHRGNLVARLKGNGQLKPLILLSHLDVVGANSSQWSQAPFAGTVSGGYVWGRGALDMKGMLAMELVSLLHFKRKGQVPKRDIILVATADEEAGGEYGMDWLMDQQIPGLKEAEYVINEGGEGTIRNGIPVYACQNGEKGLLWVKVTVKGTPGHASMPSNDNAIAHMGKILNKIRRYKRPMVLSETTRGFLTELAQQKGISLLSDPTARDYTLKLFASNSFRRERSVQAMLFNTISPTVIKAGDKTNVLPETCDLTLDCRLLPGETPEHFLEELRKVISDSKVSLEILQASLPTESPIDTGLFKSIRKVVQQVNPEALVVPYLSPGATDSRHFRQLGITAYGFMPIIISESELQRMHGIDERISLLNLEKGTQILFKVLEEVC